MGMQGVAQAKVVLVTGGAKGVGIGISESFLAAGATVIVCGRAAPEQLPSHQGREAEFIAADIRDAAAREALFGEIQRRRDRQPLARWMTP